MTLAEAADELGVTAGALRIQIERGSLRATKLGGRFWVVTEDEVARYRLEHKGKAHGPSKRKRTTPDE